MGWSLDTMKLYYQRMCSSKSMGESNTAVSAYKTYRHLQQYCSHPSKYSSCRDWFHVLYSSDCATVIAVLRELASVFTYKFLGNFVQNNRIPNIMPSDLMFDACIESAFRIFRVLFSKIVLNWGKNNQLLIV